MSTGQAHDTQVTPQPHGNRQQDARGNGKIHEHADPSASSSRAAVRGNGARKTEVDRGPNAKVGEKRPKMHNASTADTGSDASPGPATSPSARLLVRLESLMTQQVNVSEGYRELMSSCAEHLERIREEHHALVGRSTQQAQQLVSQYENAAHRLREERDALVTQLHETRHRAAEEMRANAAAATELLKRVEQERTAWQRQVENAQAENAAQRSQLRELNQELAEALNSRDRVAAHVATVEQKLENVVMPLREELDRARAEVADLRVALNDAHEQIEALQILSGVPRN